MTLVTIEYRLKNIFDDYDSFIFPGNKTQNRDNHISITRSCAWSNTGCHLSR